MAAGSSKDFLHGTLSDAQPPDSPIVAEGWAGIAFDRNRYEYFAPEDVWIAWLEVHVSRPSSSKQIEIVSFKDVEAERNGFFAAPSLCTLHEFLTEDARFLTDHYVLSRSSEWVVRLDQDVTLFAAKADFVSEVLARLGGPTDVMARMVEDFDPGTGDPVGLNGFLLEITKGLRS